MDDDGKSNSHNIYRYCFVCINSGRKRLMLYFKFKDSKWIKAKSKNFASMFYELSSVSSLVPCIGFTNNETQTMMQIFSKKD